MKTAEELEKSINVGDQWKFFQLLTQLPEEKMHPDQRREMKRAFYAGAGQILMLLRNHLPDLPEDVGVVKLEEMVDEIQHFWLNEQKTQN